MPRRWRWETSNRGYTEVLPAIEGVAFLKGSGVERQARLLDM
jgi:hypothetical protein